MSAEPTLPAITRITSIRADARTYHFDPPVIVYAGEQVWPGTDGSIIVTAADGGWPRHYQGKRTEAPAEPPR